VCVGYEPSSEPLCSGYRGPALDFSNVLFVFFQFRKDFSHALDWVKKIALNGLISVGLANRRGLTCDEFQRK
jgi:hypothetical protein